MSEQFCNYRTRAPFTEAWYHLERRESQIVSTVMNLIIIERLRERSKSDETQVKIVQKTWAWISASSATDMS